MIEAQATARGVRTSAQKAGLVLELIRGKDVNRALATLQFTKKTIAREIAKVLRSAVANAEANHGLIGDDLVVSAAYIDEGPTIKRWRARARGRVAPIHKRTCHITVKLAPTDAAPAAPKTRAAVPAKTATEPTSEEKASRRRTRKAEQEQEATA